MRRLFVGIDPGKHGAFAVLNSQMEVFEVKQMPFIEKDLDLPMIASYVREWKSQCDELIACIEKVHAMPGQGVSSMFSFGYVTGCIHGVLASFSVPRNLVTPQAWKKVILAGTNKSKNASVEYCSRVYPDVSLLPTPRSTKPNDGMADAICIARYLITTRVK